MQKEIVRLDKVNKTYEMGESEIRALNRANLSVRKGDFIAITGPSGSGKTTLMNLVGALDIPSQGRIFLDDRDIAHMEESELANIRGKKIGFVFQTFNLIPTLTAIENVMLPMIFIGTNKEERKARAIDLLKGVGLEDRMYHLPNELSGGERQRVAIARALANDPEVILADEPTGNLDTKTGDEILHLFMKMNKEGKTIILVTHDPEMAKHARHVIRLKDGRIMK